MVSNIDNTNNKIATKSDISKSILDLIDSKFLNMTDDEKKNMDTKIQSKLKRGKRLTAEEMKYLSNTNPMMYAHALRVQREAKAVENRLKHAKSKEEVNRIIGSAISGISKKDPDKEYLIAAFNELAKEIHKSPSYSRLPDTMEDAKRKVKIGENKVEWDDEEDDNDLMNWSPLQEVIDAMPGFSAGA